MKRNLLKTKNRDIQLYYISTDIELDELRELFFLLPKKDNSWSDKKKKDFILGRLCAQENLENIIFISSGKNGAPKFLDGLKGSISHSKDYAVACTTRKPGIISLGVDIEKIVSAKRVEVIKKMTLLPRELDFINSCKEEEKRKIATIIFSAKESLYKLINPLAGCYINFYEGEFTRFSPESGEFSIKLISEKEELHPFLGEYHGQVYEINDNILTILQLLN